MERLLSLQETAEALGLSIQRIYQLDDELKPITQPRGTKMLSRWYKPEIVAEAAARRREAPARLSAKGIKAMANSVAGRVLREHVERAAFFFGVCAEDLKAVKDAITAIANKLDGGVA